MKELIEGLAILQNYNDKWFPGLVGIYAGPNCNKLSDLDDAKLESLGWEWDEFIGAWFKPNKVL